MRKTVRTAIIGFVAFAILAVIQPSSTNATSYSIAPGLDENTDNALCSLSEAIENINDQAQTNPDCLAGDGVSDTINISAGTVTLIANLPVLSRSVTIAGAGMGSSIIDYRQLHGISIQGQGSEKLVAKDFKITGFMNRGINIDRSNSDLQRIDIDGTNSTNDSGFQAGVQISSNTNSTLTSVMENLHVHDINATAENGAFGIVSMISDGSYLDISIRNTTVNSLSNSTGQIHAISLTGGVFDGSGTTSKIVTALENVTISDITSPTLNAHGVALLARDDASTSNVNLTASNVTITGVKGQQNNGLVESSALVVGGASTDASGLVNATINLRNVLLAGNTSANVPSNCFTLNFTPFLGGSSDGTVNSTFTSNGGNLSDDATCSASLTNTKDQNSLTTLASTLSPLANNGGAVPTRALINGSPAIDSGLTLANILTDARGVARPAGLAFDSGAYESPFTANASSNSCHDHSTKTCRNRTVRTNSHHPLGHTLNSQHCNSLETAPTHSKSLNLIRATLTQESGHPELVQDDQSQS